ncbi:ectonucleotide pyrophosphatase/phosphodiesterase [Bacteroidota bacterium]
MKIRIAYIFLIVFSFACSSERGDSEKKQGSEQYVVMLSMDGFRWDYSEKANTPNLDYIEEVGVHADASIPCFPTKTFPNHFSIATGLYPENHGIVFNDFYANDINKFYSISNTESVADSSFYFGEPIWVTAEKQGVKSASYFWVGSEAMHDKIFPSYSHNYNGSVPFEKRIEGVIEWLELPENERPHLIMWYIQEPDSKGHDVGPNHHETVEMVEYLDSLVGVFIQKIAALPIADNINVIVTSDHGMGEISEERVVYLDKLIQKDWIEHIDGGNPVYSIGAKEEFYDTIYSILSNSDHLQIWKKEDVPERLHFSKSKRIKDFIVVADSSWSLSKSSKKKSYSGGAHGYDNRNKDMHTIFYAYGPAFKKGYNHKSINAIDIYPLICKILKIEPKKVDGSLENTIQMLQIKNDKGEIGKNL